MAFIKSDFYNNHKKWKISSGYGKLYTICEDIINLIKGI